MLFKLLANLFSRDVSQNWKKALFIIVFVCVLVFSSMIFFSVFPGQGPNIFLFLVFSVMGLTVVVIVFDKHFESKSQAKKEEKEFARSHNKPSNKQKPITPSSGGRLFK
jgi:uncharacterized membrane protein